MIQIPKWMNLFRKMQNISKQKIDTIEFFIKILLTILSFIWGYYYVYIPVSEYAKTDYSIYMIIYALPIDDWYGPSTYYYYSPLFYIIFYPFYRLGYGFFIWTGALFYCYGVIKSIQKLEILFYIPVIHVITFQFWAFFVYGNVDLYFFGFFLWLWDHPKSDATKGFLLGICTFKGTVLYLIPFFFYHAKKRKKS